MIVSYDKIYKDVENLIKKYGTRNPREILKERNVTLISFKENTKLLGMYKIILRNRFVFYNPYIDDRLLRMVLAHELGHDMYHKEQAKKSDLVEYELFDINSSMETESNIFAAHLLLDEDEIMEYLVQGYTYDELASMFNVNVNLMIFKLNEMHRLGSILKKPDILEKKFLNKIDGRKTENFEFQIDFLKT